MSNSSDQKPEIVPRQWLTAPEWLIVLALIVILCLFIIPQPRMAVTSASRDLCDHNLRRIGIALHNYHDAYGSLPPAYTVDVQGKRLHSWRTLILPFLEEQKLYDSIYLSKPWDDAANAEARRRFVNVYCCRKAQPNSNRTCYLANALREGCFPGSHSLRFSEIKDGMSQTIAILEVPADEAVEWMSPYDVDEALMSKLSPHISFPHPGIIQTLRVDGAVIALLLEKEFNQLKARMTIAGEESVVDNY